MKDRTTRVEQPLLIPSKNALKRRTLPLIDVVKPSSEEIRKIQFLCPKEYFRQIYSVPHIRDDTFSLFTLILTKSWTRWQTEGAEIKEKNYIFLPITVGGNYKLKIEGESPGLPSGYGRRLMFQRSWVRNPEPHTGWIFFHIYLL